jgi:hypothetical protein
MKKINRKRGSRAHASGQPRPKHELSEEQLDRVAGGVVTSGSSAGVVTSGSPTSAISSLSSGVGSGGDAPPTETITFVYGALKVQYTPQKK